MIVGALGGIVFSVSSRTVKTISNLVWSGSARYATHDLHAGNSISEYTGTNLAKITFDIQLLSSLGVAPCRSRSGGCLIWSGKARRCRLQSAITDTGATAGRS